VIDLGVLRRLGIAYGSSIDDLGFRHRNETNGAGTNFATEHYILVLSWLPRQCILGFLSTKQFEALLEQSQIDNSSSGTLFSSSYLDHDMTSIIQIFHFLSMKRKLASRQFYSTFPEQELPYSQQTERKLLDNVVIKMLIIILFIAGCGHVCVYGR
jgi:hypothetical protein